MLIPHAADCDPTPPHLKPKQLLCQNTHNWRRGGRNSALKRAVKRVDETAHVWRHNLREDGIVARRAWPAGQDCGRAQHGSVGCHASR